MSKPSVIVITGSWATGKTKMLKELSRVLGFPGYSRDTYKEAKYDAGVNGDFDVESYEAMFRDVRESVRKNQSCIIESDFDDAEQVSRLKDLLAQEKVQAVQVHLFANDRALHERIIHRVTSGERHPGHGDERFVEESRAALAMEEPEMFVQKAIEIPGELIEVDTSDFGEVDYEGIGRRVKNILEKEINVTFEHLAKNR